MIDLTTDQKEKLNRSINEWRDMLYMPERYEYAVFSIPNDTAMNLREYPFNLTLRRPK